MNILCTLLKIHVFKLLLLTENSCILFIYFYIVTYFHGYTYILINRIIPVLNTKKKKC